MAIVGASPTACTKDILDFRFLGFEVVQLWPNANLKSQINNLKFRKGCRLTGKPSVSRIEVFSSNLNVLAKFGRWRAVARNWS
jgi:hypothetical protein